MSSFVHVLIALFCLGISVTTLRDVRANFYKLLFFSGFGVIHGIVPAITPEYARNQAIAESVRLHASVYCFFGILVFTVGWWLYDTAFGEDTISDRLLTVVRQPRCRRLYTRLFWVCAVLGVAGWIGSIYLSGATLATMMSGNRFDFRFGGHSYLSTIVLYLSLLALMPGFLGFFLARPYRLAGILYAIAFASAFFWVSHGGRGTTLGLLGACLGGFVMRKRVSIPRLTVVGGVGIALFMLTVSLYMVRKTMIGKSPLETLESVIAVESYRSILSRDPLNYHEIFVAVVDGIPDRHPYLNGATYRRILVCYLPRAYFPDIKPEDVNATVGREIFGTRATKYVTIPPSIPGDAYVNFWGWPGLGLLFIKGFWLSWLVNRCRTSVLWFTCFSPFFVMIVMLGLRGQPYELFLSGLFLVLALWCLGWICGIPFHRLQFDMQRADIPSERQFVLAGSSVAGPIRGSE